MKKRLSKSINLGITLGELQTQLLTLALAVTGVTFFELFQVGLHEAVLFALHGQGQT